MEKIGRILSWLSQGLFFFQWGTGQDRSIGIFGAMFFFFKKGKLSLL